ncbi:MAG: hypothetical protein WD273_11830 [Trueperaceae bacterium]
MRRLQQRALVALENGKPVRVSWSSASSGRASLKPGSTGTPSGGRVTRIIDEWRVAGRWWATEMRRDYYLLELHGGRLIELYGEGEHWCVTGVAD